MRESMTFFFFPTCEGWTGTKAYLCVYIYTHIRICIHNINYTSICTHLILDDFCVLEQVVYLSMYWFVLRSCVFAYMYEGEHEREYDYEAQEEKCTKNYRSKQVSVLLLRERASERANEREREGERGSKPATAGA